VERTVKAAASDIANVDAYLATLPPGDSRRQEVQRQRRFYEYVASTALARQQRASTIPASLLRLARSQAGISQTALARRVGTSSQAVSRYERGVACPRRGAFERLLAACGTTEDELFRFVNAA
jgi:ribosome-binding protein aMBF1 (putative translation factor)